MRLPTRLITALYIAGVNLHPVSAIAGGEPAQLDELPFVASVRLSQHACGATLINSRQLLSAASCIRGRPASSFTIRTGTIQRQVGGKLTGLAEIYVHPEYDPRTLQNDIAILNLAEPVDDVTPAVLPTSPEPPAPGSEVIIAGWGETLPGGSDAGILNRASLPVVDDKTCRAQYKDTAMIFADQFCIGIEEGGKGSCDHDEGGPVLQGNTLVGVLSAGTTCGLAGYADIDTAVGAHLDWINSHLIK